MFDLPGLPQQGGHSVRVFENTIVANNTPNFAPAGNIVASVPTGTGVLIMANRDVHVFDNEIGDNGTANVIVTAYRAEFQDANYNPLPRNIMIRDNRFGPTGFAPAGEIAALGAGGRAVARRAVGRGHDVFGGRHAAERECAHRRARQPLHAYGRGKLPLARRAGGGRAAQRSRARPHAAATA